MIEEELTDQIIGAAIAVHRYWGPGLSVPSNRSNVEFPLPLDVDLVNKSFSAETSSSGGGNSTFSVTSCPGLLRVSVTPW